MQKLKIRAERIMGSTAYIKTCKNSLQAFVGGVSAAPSRVSTLTMSEEKARAKLTWQSLDHRIWQAAFADEQELSQVVSSPKEFIKNRHLTVIGFSDQVPFWVKLGSTGTQLYMEKELKRRRVSSKTSAEGSTEVVSAEQGSEEQKPPEISTLTRADGQAEEDKYRITYEARQVLYNYFSEDPSAVPCVWWQMVLWMCLELSTAGFRTFLKMANGWKMRDSSTVAFWKRGKLETL